MKPRKCVPSSPASIPVARRVLGQAMRYARAHDPGWERTRAATGALVGMGLGGGPAVGLLALAGRSLLLAALGGIVGMLGTMTLAAAGERPGWHVVRLGAVAAGSGALAAVLIPWTAASYVAFVAVTAAGAWATRWGPAGTSLGMVAFMAYFFALFSGASPGDVPWIVVVAAVGGLATAVTGLVLLPDRPAVRLRRLVPALLARTSHAVDAAIAVVETGDDDRRIRLVRRTAGVQELALRIDGLLDHRHVRTSVADPAGLRIAVLVVEGLTDQLAWAVLSSTAGLRDDQRAHLAAALRRARRPLDADLEHVVAPLVPRLHADGDDRAIEVLERLAVAAQQVARAARPVPPGGAQPSDAEDQPPSEEVWDEDDAGLDGSDGSLPSLRKVVQIVLAGSLSLVLEPAAHAP